MDNDKLNREYRHLNKVFGHPCLVHATKKHLLKKILHSGKLYIPSERENAERGLGLCFLDKLLEVDNALFFRPGFAYNTSHHDFPTAIIFAPSVLDRHWEVYEPNVVHCAAKEMVRFLQKNDFEQVEILKERGLRKEIEEFFRTDSDPHYFDEGKPSGLLPYWEFTDLLKQAYLHSKVRSELRVHLLKFQKKSLVKHFRKRFIEKVYWKANIRRSEIMCYKSLSLHNSHLMGFYIKSPSEEDVAMVAEFQKKHGKPILLFDGHQTRKIG